MIVYFRMRYLLVLFLSMVFCSDKLRMKNFFLIGNKNSTGITRKVKSILQSFFKLNSCDYVSVVVKGFVRGFVYDRSL